MKIGVKSDLFYGIGELFFALALICFLPLMAFAGTPDHQQIITSGQSLDIQNYPNAHSAIVYDLEDHRLNPDGTSTGIFDTYYRIFTEAGAQQLKTLKLRFNTHYEELEITKLERITPDGKADLPELEKNLRRVSSAEQMNSNIYDPDMQELVLTIPELHPGDILHLQAVRKQRKAVIPGHWSNIFLLEYDVPLLRGEIKISTPSDYPLQSVVLKGEISGNTVNHQIEKKNHETVYRWQTENVPQALTEEKMPPLYTCGRRLLVSTLKNWEEVSVWYYKLCEKALSDITPELKEKVTKLTANTPATDEKMRRIFDFVSRDIRYTGITSEQESPGFEPHPVGDTFRQRHGVCRDKAALLCAMLNLAGFKAYPCLIMAGEPKDPEVANGFFNHAITAVEKSPGEYILMDPTSENTKSLLPEHLTNKSFLVARPEGDTLRRSPVIAPEQNQMLIDTDCQLDSGGILHGECTITFTGINDLIYREAFALWDQQKLRQFISNRVQTAIPNGELLEFRLLPENLRQSGDDLKLVFSFTAKSQLPSSTTPGPLPIPEFAPKLSVLQFILPVNDRKTRRFPLLFDSTLETRESLTLQLPRQLKIRQLPENISSSVPAFSWERKFTCEDSKIKLTARSVLNTLELPSADYPAFKLECDKFQSANRAMPIAELDYGNLETKDLANEFPQADYVILDRHSELSFNEKNKEHQTTVREKYYILTYAGVKELSERMISYFPDFEEVSCEITLQLADGKTMQLTPEDCRIMDAPDAGLAPRYPQAKILVAAIPGVETGSTLEVVTTRKSRLPFYSKMFPFQSRQPMKACSFTLNSSQNSFILPKFMETASLHTAEENGSRQHRWTSRSVQALPKDIQVPPDLLTIPNVTVAKYDYSNFSKLILTALEERINQTDDRFIRKILTDWQITPEMSTREKVEKIRANTCFWRIRQSGPDYLQIPLSRLNPPDVTLNEAYGNSADRAILIAALLKNAKVDYRLFAVNDKWNYTPELARMLNRRMLTDFPVILVNIPELEYFLNDTTSFAAPGCVRHEDKIAIDLHNGRLVQISPHASKRTREEITYQMTVYPDGAGKVKVTRKYYGNLFETENLRYQFLLDDEKERHFNQLAKQIHPQAEISGEPEVDFSGYPAVVEFTVQSPQLAVLSGNMMTISLPGFEAMRRQLILPGTERTLPLNWEQSTDLEINHHIESPYGFSLVSGRSAIRDIGRPGFARYLERSSTDRENIRINSKLHIQSGNFKPVDYDLLLNIQSLLLNARSRTLVFERKSGKGTL